jgi:hypothetical protein
MPSPGALAVDPDGKVTIAGISTFVVRYRPDGAPDLSFGAYGSGAIGVGDEYTTASDVSPTLPDGTTIVTGLKYPGLFMARIAVPGTVSGFPVHYAHHVPGPARFAAADIDATGRAFFASGDKRALHLTVAGANGVQESTRTYSVALEDARVRDVALAPDGTIAVAGVVSVINGTRTTETAFVARFEAIPPPPLPQAGNPDQPGAGQPQSATPTRLAVRLPTRLQLDRRGRLSVRLKSNREVSARVRATLKIAGQRRSRQAKTRTVALPAGREVIVRMTLASRDRAAIRSALRARKRVTAQVRVTAPGMPAMTKRVRVSR